MSDPPEIEDRIIAAIRRIIRAIDLQSRRLVERWSLTGPQLVALREVRRLGAPTIGALARAVHLSQPTVSGILARLEARGLVHRERAPSDRRAVVVTVTPEGERVLADAPSLLQDRFHSELARLHEWERHALLAALERIGSMMEAEGIDAAPILETGPVAPERPAEPRDEGEAKQ